MKKHLLKMFTLAVCLTLSALGLSAESFDVTFLKTSLNKSIQNYTTTAETSSTYGGSKWQTVNFNNSQKNWDYIRCGAKNTTDGKASISSLSAIPYNVKKVLFSVPKLQNGTASVKLLIADNASFTNPTQVVTESDQAKTGVWTYVLPAGCQDKYYKFDVTYTNTSANSNGVLDCDKITFEYSLTVAPEKPEIIVDKKLVTITAEEGAEIHYTLDGTTPTAESELYTEPITLEKTSTVKAIAVKDGETSDVAERLVVCDKPGDITMTLKGNELINGGTYSANTADVFTIYSQYATSYYYKNEADDRIDIVDGKFTLLEGTNTLQFYAENEIGSAPEFECTFDITKATFEDKTATFDFVDSSKFGLTNITNGQKYEEHVFHLYSDGVTMDFTDVNYRWWSSTDLRVYASGDSKNFVMRVPEGSHIKSISFTATDFALEVNEETPGSFSNKVFTPAAGKLSHKAVFTATGTSKITSITVEYTINDTEAEVDDLEFDEESRTLRAPEGFHIKYKIEEKERSDYFKKPERVAAAESAEKDDDDFTTVYHHEFALDDYKDNMSTSDPTKVMVATVKAYNPATNAEGNPFVFTLTDEGGVSGVENVEVEAAGVARFFNLNGVEVGADALTPGIYIRRDGNKASKVVVR